MGMNMNGTGGSSYGSKGEYNYGKNGSYNYGGSPLFLDPAQGPPGKTRQSHY